MVGTLPFNKSFKGINNSPNENVGGDIYQSNSTFVSFYGNYILQGKRTDHFIQELKVSRSLIPSWNLQAEVTGSYRIIKDGTTRNTFFVTLGFRTLLFEEENLL
ncbi:MAG: hypothetical protein HC830_03740 [Bacteroidetes bacterium]|nr:hypothetical protein [Bacteroidota bacterium]